MCTSTFEKTRRPGSCRTLSMGIIDGGFDGSCYQDIYGDKNIRLCSIQYRTEDLAACTPDEFKCELPD
jgi:hypothetical protein